MSTIYAIIHIMTVIMRTIYVEINTLCSAIRTMHVKFIHIIRTIYMTCYVLCMRIIRIMYAIMRTLYKKMYIMDMHLIDAYYVRIIKTSIKCMLIKYARTMYKVTYKYTRIIHK